MHSRWDLTTVLCSGKRNNYVEKVRPCLVIKGSVKTKKNLNCSSIYLLENMMNIITDVIGVRL
jgi:hypothetical protein